MASAPPKIIPSDPQWFTGYVPSAVEWATWWQRKVDFPAPINQGGTGSQTVADANLKLQQRSVILGGAMVPVSVLNCYALDTSTAPVELQLPPLASVNPGDWIDCLDIAYNANVNAIQVFADGTEAINMWGVPSNTQMISIAGTAFQLVATSAFWVLQW